ncbi:DUF499 domain-containing protein [Halorubrum ezzemoulense]|uniref:DUF499 domain-containing protein n=1 Tax=Halorubrum ezzemoulense TaxID=337243 RepID=UPI0023314B16|nr:DUF499 domain-containing protein [Halorubrum ezzemoulense]MDB2239141.1 DUF499 domain-containing protein [Halorubrum ezzemoulense]MDB2249674.1 DUF499 domain-containing protein [Halorubrum ezzemoulense]
MSTEGTPGAISDHVTLSRELREGSGTIKGQIRLYDVESDEETLESDASRFFQRTLLTQGLEDSFKRLRDTLNGEDTDRIHEMYGPYGTGKSHQMVALYHAFANPETVGDWAEGRIDGLAEALPDSATPIVVSLQKSQSDYLWEPFFDALDYEPDEDEFDDGGYPPIDMIQEAVGDRTVAFFVDELEDWFGSLQGRRKRANKGFLQALLETTSRPATELFAVVSVLREGSEVHDILSRQETVPVNMSNQVDIRDVLRHRLIGEVTDEAGVRTLVEHYIETYADTDYVDLPEGLREDMLQTYPFHPELIDALKTRYFAETESGATRGMLFLFAKLLKDQHDDTDLLTHGTVDAVEYNDELTRINVEHARPDRCYEDITDRLADANIDYGREILSTVLIYSLTPGLDEGATKGDIIQGTYHQGDRVNDVVVDLERLQGEVYHLWETDDRYVIREDENPRSLVRNAARDIPDEDAMELLGETVESIFGGSTHAVGFSKELGSVPDSQNIKLVVRNEPWDEDSVAAVIKNQPAGRQWRNSLVFIQPNNDKRISPSDQQDKFLGKAKEVLGAEIRKEDPNLSEEIREEIDELHDEYKDELRSRLTGAYGEVIDGNDLLNEFGYAAATPLENIVPTDPVLNHRNIAQAMEADPFDIEQSIWAIVQDRLDSRSSTTIEDLYEEFLRNPTMPIPGDVNVVVNAVENELEGEPVLAHDGSEFKPQFRNLGRDTTLVLESDVERWGVDDVEEELRRRFSGGTTDVDVGDFELELMQDIEVWIESDSHDAVMRAVGRLAADDKYVLVSGTEIIDKARSDATLRDVSDVTEIGADEIRSRIEDVVEASGEADTSQVLTAIRGDADLYLPKEETETGFRAAVTGLLSDGYKIKDDWSFLGSLGDRNPTRVVVVPWISEKNEQRILDDIRDMEEDRDFDVDEIQSNVVPDETEHAIRHFLLANLGEDEPAYVVGATGSTDPGEWFPGAGFKTYGTGGETFEYTGTSVSDLRDKWLDGDITGSVSYGSISYTTTDGSGGPGTFNEIGLSKVHVDLQLELGQSHDTVTSMFEAFPESATDIDVMIEFE